MTEHSEAGDCRLILAWCELVLAEGYPMDVDTTDLLEKARALHGAEHHALATALAVDAIRRAMQARRRGVQV